MTVGNRKFLIEERRRQVASMLAQSMTEAEIAERLGYDQTTISTDVVALKKMSQQFIFDLAKSELAFHYKRCIDRVEQVIRESWKRYNDAGVSEKGKSAALKLIVDATAVQFKLYNEGPQVLAVKKLDERLDRIEINQTNR